MPLVCEMSKLLTAFALVLLGHSPAGVDCLAEFASLDPGGGFNVSWEYDNTTIWFSLAVKTNGWVGFGFSPDGAMTNSDVVLVTHSGIKDCHTLDVYSSPIVDSHQDWILDSRFSALGVTFIRLSRPLVLCHDSEDMDITGDTIRLIYAYGDSEQASYHSYYRGSKSVYLLTQERARLRTLVPPNSLKFDIVMDNVIVPAQRTSRWCQLKKAPELRSKHHVVLFEPEHAGMILTRRITVLGCWDIDGDAIIDRGHHSHSCSSPSMPPSMKLCRKTLFDWSTGGGPFYFPELAGQDLGGHDSPTYFLLQIQYDNPVLLEDYRDSSGIRITYTSTRQYDAGTVSVGLTDTMSGIVVPPNSPYMDIPTICPKTCTQSLLPPSGITVFGYSLHTNGLGRRVELKHHYRNGTAAVVGKDDFYDFNFQEYKNLREGVKVMPGDELQITCRMSSESRDHLTVGGIGIDHETCYALLLYYPKVDFGRCGSVPEFQKNSNQSSLYNALGVDRPPSFQTDQSGVFSSVRWTLARREALQNAYFDSPHYADCGAENNVDNTTFLGPLSIPADSRLPQHTGAAECFQETETQQTATRQLKVGLITAPPPVVHEGELHQTTARENTVSKDLLVSLGQHPSDDEAIIHVEAYGDSSAFKAVPTVVLTILISLCLTVILL